MKEPIKPLYADLKHSKNIQNRIENSSSLVESFFKFEASHPGTEIVRWKNPESLEYTEKYTNTQIKNHAFRISQRIMQGAKTAVFCNNHQDLMAIHLASWLKGGYLIFIYDTDNIEQIDYKIRKSGANHIVCDSRTIKSIEKLKGSCLSHLDSVILIGDKKSYDTDSFNLENLKHMYLNDILDSGSDISQINFDSIKLNLNSKAGLLFTSGTTSSPKKILLTHGNFLASITSWLKSLNLQDSVRYPSFLPNAHVFQVALDYCSLVGGLLPYITSKESLKEDLPKIEPEFFAAVPKVYSGISKGVTQNLRTKLPFLLKRNNLNNESFYKKSIVKFLLASKIKKKLGISNLKWIISGGAKLSGEDFDFFNDILSLPISEGYGMSETTAGISVGGPLIIKGSSGKILDDIKVNIKSSDSNSKKGTVWIKGPQIYKAPKSMLDQDGFFNTGDIGYVEDGYLYITGRESSRVKMANGKFFNLETITQLILEEFSTLTQAVPVILNRDKGVLLINVLEGKRKIDINKLNQILSLKLKGLQFEEVKIIEELTIENGYLTPSLKTKTSKVIDDYNEGKL